MNLLRITFLILLFSYSSYAQIELKGIVKDSSNVAVEFANVVLTNQKNEIVKGAITDEKGEFSLSAKKGAYKLSISFLGYKDWVKEITLENSFDFGIIILEESKNNLDEVVITVEKPVVRREVDRLVFDVRNSIIANAGDAINVLQVTPGIRANGNDISLIGKSSVGILVNGRSVSLSGEDLTNYLRSINSDDILKIEVITNPPARYEAEGNSGLINIVLKKVKQDSYSATIRNTYIQTTYPAYSLGGSLLFNKKGWSISANTSAKKGAYGVEERSSIFYNNQTWNGRTKRKDYFEFLNGRIGFDYQISDNTSIGAQYQGLYSEPDIRDVNTIDIVSNATNAVDSIIRSGGFNDKKIRNHSINAHLISKLDTIGKQISFDLDYFTYKSDQNRNFDSENFQSNGISTNNRLSALNQSLQDITIYSAKTDVDFPLKWANISFGGKVSTITNDSQVQYFDTTTGIPIIDESQSDDFQYKENTQALYFSFGKSLGKKWRTKIGLRLETTQTTATSLTLNQINENDYEALFPRAYLSYSLNDKNSFSLSYGRRIDRPAYWELNPFRWYINAISYSEGNPFLQPSFTDNYELSYNYRSIYSATFYVSHVTDGFGQVILLNPNTEDQIFVRRNYYSTTDVGLSQSINFSPFKFWKSYNQIYSYYVSSDINSNFQIPEYNGFSAYLSTYNLFNINKEKTISGQIQYWYQFPAKTRNRDVEQHSSLNLGVIFLLLNKNLRLSITGFDIFRTFNPNIETFSNNIRRISSVYNDERRFAISLSYKFGNNKINVRKRDFGNEDEKKRAN